MRAELRRFLKCRGGATAIEYACHEGNYALSNILSGERYQERMEAEEKTGGR